LWTWVVSQSEIIAHSVSTSWSRKCCSSAVSCARGSDTSADHAGRPEKSSPSQPTVPASSASRSVCDIGGITLRKIRSTGRVINGLRTGATAIGRTRSPSKATTTVSTTMDAFIECS